jgi:hypothetical protein
MWPDLPDSQDLFGGEAMSATVHPLKPYLAEIAEFRNAKGLRHPLLVILL